MGAFPLRDYGLILLHDFTRILAFGKSGVVWETPRLSWDGLKIEKVKGGIVRGYAWDAPNNCNVAFEVNASSGEFKGGASSELLEMR